MTRAPTSDGGRRPDVVSWAVVVGHTVIVFGAIHLAAALGPTPMVAILWLWFGFALNGYLNLLHECAHSLTFRRRRTSERLARWLIGPLVLADFDGYRSRHLAHHKHLGDDLDTKDAYLVDIGGGQLPRFILQCLTLQEAARKFRHQAGPSAGEEPGGGAALRGALGRIALAQGALLATVVAVAVMAHGPTTRAAAATALAYGFVCLHGMGSLTVLAATLRAIAEHQLGLPASLQEGRAALRNLRAGPVATLFFGSYGFADHATHHRRAGIPYYRLPATTAALSVDEPLLVATGSYASTLRALRGRAEVLSASEPGPAAGRSRSHSPSAGRGRPGPPR